MLTATYSIVALRLEQKKVRWNFSVLQQYILNSIKNLKQASGLEVESMLNRLSQFEQDCHQRKMEVFVIPAMRKISRETDALLDELESLSSISLTMLRTLREKLQDVLRLGIFKIEEVCVSLELCCSNFYARLSKEDELVEIAERVIPGETWFGIAANFLSYDAQFAKATPLVIDEEDQ
jgi:hypothetical protein